mgnify:CR=1 FL=1
MSNNATENSASRRIATVLDEGSFVESVVQLQQEIQISTCRKKKLRLTGSLPAME